MNNEVNYASLLNGKLMFGDPFNIPDGVDIIVDTLSVYDKEYVFKVDESKVTKFPMRPGFEPEYINLFETLIGNLDHEIMQGKSVYILDPDGTERAALLAWRILVRNTRCQIVYALELVNEAYQARTNKPSKWKLVEIPRFNRQMFFGKILAKGGYTRINKRAFSKVRKRHLGCSSHVENVIHRTRGQIHTDSLIDRISSGLYLDPMRIGYMNIRLVPTAEGVWHGLSGRYLGSVEIPFVSAYGVHTVETSPNFRNAFFSLWVFEEHLTCLEPNATFMTEKPNIDFFTLHAQMVGTLEPMKKHPLYERKTPTFKGKSPKFLYWRGEMIPFKYAKVYIYSSLYRRMIMKTRVYRDLVNTVESGANVLILDYDAVDFNELGMTYEEFMNDEEQPWTDAHILYGMLTNEMPWLIEDV